MKKLLSLTLILAIAAASQAGNVVVVNGPKQPVPVTTVATYRRDSPYHDHGLFPARYH